MTGRVVMVCGPSSVGKTSVAKQLQEQLIEPYLHVGLDNFFSMFPHHWKDHPRGPGAGFWYDDTTDPDSKPRTRIRHRGAGAYLLSGMRAAVKALILEENDVTVDEMPIDETILPAWRRDLLAPKQFWVKLTAPLEVLEDRERHRTHRQKLGNARGHIDTPDDIAWDLVVQAADHDPADIARLIITRCPFLCS